MKIFHNLSNINTPDESIVFIIKHEKIGIFMKLFLIGIFIIFSYANLLLEASGNHIPSSNLSCMDETPSKITLRHREHEGVGYKTGYTTLEAFLTPNWNRNFQPYADLRTHLMNDGKWATNIGLGARGAPTEKWVIGGNFYFDYREVSHMPCYQLGSGIELLSPYIDFRLNGYLPIGKKSHISQDRFERFEGNNIILKRSVKASLASIYAEIGGWIPNLSNYFQLYIAAGPYYLGSRQTEVIKDKTVKFGNSWGGKYRVLARVFEYFDAGIELTHDSIFHTNIQGYLGVSLPLGPSKMYRGFKKRENQENCRISRKFRQRITQPVHRNEIIPIEKKGAELKATTKNGQAADFVFVDPSALPGGDGTFEKPLREFSEAKSLYRKPIVTLVRKDDDEKHPFIIDPTEEVTPNDSDSNQISALNRLIAQFYGVDLKQPEN